MGNNASPAGARVVFLALVDVRPTRAFMPEHGDVPDETCFNSTGVVVVCVI